MERGCCHNPRIAALAVGFWMLASRCLAFFPQWPGHAVGTVAKFSRTHRCRSMGSLKEISRPTISQPSKLSVGYTACYAPKMSATRLTKGLQVGTLTTAPTTIERSRPATAARLNFIDFNPDTPAMGDGVSTPIIVMHGLLGNARNFQGWGLKLLKILERDRRLFAVDMRNHGGSSHCDSMTYEEMADDVLGFLADQGLSRAVLVGHSMGGKAAAMTALLHPDVVEGLVVMDIAPVSYSMVDSTIWGNTQNIVSAIKEMPLEGVRGRKDADERLSKDIVDPALRAFAVTNLGKKEDGTEDWSWKINIDAIHQSMTSLAQFDSMVGSEDGRDSLRDGPAESSLRPYNGDALFIAGGNSRYVRSQHLGKIGSFFPRFVLQTVKGAGHWVHADKPEETTEIVKMFLDRDELP